MMRFSNNKIDFGKMDDELLLVDFINEDIPNTMNKLDNDTVLDIMEYTEGYIIEVEDRKINLVSTFGVSTVEKDVGVLGLLGEAKREAWSQVEADVRDNSENPDYSIEDSDHYGSFERLQDCIEDYKRECVREIDCEDDLQRRVLCDLLRPHLHGKDMPLEMAGDFLKIVEGDNDINYQFDSYRKVFLENDPEFEIFDYTCEAIDLVEHFIEDLDLEETVSLKDFFLENFYDNDKNVERGSRGEPSSSVSDSNIENFSQKNIVEKFIDDVKTRFSSNTDKSLESMLESAGRAMKSLPDSDKSLISGWLNDNNIHNGSQMVKFLLENVKSHDKEKNVKRGASHDKGYGR